MLSGKIQHLNKFLRQSYLCKMFQGSPELKRPLVFFLPPCFCQPGCSLTLKNTTLHLTHTHTHTHTHKAEDRSISEHHLQQALAGSSVVNSLCKWSLSGSVQRAATVPHDQTCDVALKSSLHEWMSVSYTHADTHTHRNAHTAHEREFKVGARLCLNKLPSLSPTPRLHIKSKYHKYV